MSRVADFKVIRLKKGYERKLKGGYPWVFLNEIQENNKADLNKIASGSWVECQDYRGEFLAKGFGNSKSMISFRALSFNKEEQIQTKDWWKKQLHSALKLRQKFNLHTASFRWLYGEGDLIPGLVIDAYQLSNKASQATWVLSVQGHTAGIDLHFNEIILPSILEVFQTEMRPKSLGLVLRNDLNVRALEGLEIQEPKVLMSVAELENKFQAVQIHPPLLSALPLVFKVDLIKGQKTGFFLDQAQNIEQVASLIQKLRVKDSFQMLDICPYVGQWSVKLQSILPLEIPKEFTLLDASESALELAEFNLKNNSSKSAVHLIKGDMMKELQVLTTEKYDLVVCDPPALIKSKKDHPQGKQGYTKLFRESLRLVKPEGLVVCCSCSALLSEAEFEEAIHKAVVTSQRVVSWVAMGTQAVDHPIQAGFKEGHYLKMRVGIVR